MLLADEKEARVFGVHGGSWGGGFSVGGGGWGIDVLFGGEGGAFFEVGTGAEAGGAGAAEDEGSWGVVCGGVGGCVVVTVDVDVVAVIILLIAVDLLFASCVALFWIVLPILLVF